MKASRCRSCGMRLGEPEALDKGGGKPVPGDVSVCGGCGEYAIFTGRGWEVRAPTPVEKVMIESDATRQARVEVRLKQGLMPMDGQAQKETLRG